MSYTIYLANTDKSGKLERAMGQKQKALALWSMKTFTMPRMPLTT